MVLNRVIGNGKCNFVKEYLFIHLKAMTILLQQSYFLYKIHSNAVPYEHVVLGGNENCEQKYFLIKLSIKMRCYIS